MGSAFTLIWTITLAATLLQAGNGLLQAVLPLRMQAEGLSVTAIGAVAAAYGLGFAMGCYIAPTFVRHVGHIRVFASLAAVAAVTALVFTQAHSVAAWLGLRLLTGVAFACVFTVTDSWTSARATAGRRGRILSIYMVWTKVALMLSPLAVGLGSIQGDGLFMVVSAAMCLSLLPVSATTADEPPAPRAVRVDVRGLFRVAPSAAVGAFAVGLLNGPVIAIAPVYGVSIGMSQEQAAALLFALQGGSLLVQWPLGWLSDRWDRRYVIAALAGGTSVVSLAILWLGSHATPAVIMFAFACWGGLALCVYSICVAHACDLIEPDRIVPTISSLLMAWAVGSMIGPLPGAAMMDSFGPGGLFVYAIIISFALASFVLIRIWLQARPAPTSSFVALGSTSPATAALREGAEAGAEDVSAKAPEEPIVEGMPQEKSPA